MTLHRSSNHFYFGQVKTMAKSPNTRWVSRDTDPNAAVESQAESIVEKEVGPGFTQLHPIRSLLQAKATLARFHEVFSLPFPTG